jgi:hypothetical protein
VDTVGIRVVYDTILLEARFVPLEGDGLLWEKDSVCYGRQAALQRALRKLNEEEGVYPFDGSDLSHLGSFASRFLTRGDLPYNTMYFSGRALVPG